MTWQLKNNLEIYTEEVIVQHIVVGRPHRPVQNAILFVRKGWIKVRYNLKACTLLPNTVLIIQSNSIFEFIEADPNIELRILAINSGFESIAAIKIRRYDVRTFFTTSPQNHYQLTEAEFQELWEVLELLRGRLFLPNKDRTRKEIVHHLFLSAIYILADITIQYNQITFTELNRADKITKEYIQLVTANFRKERSLGFYAQKLGISPKHLSETIKQATGVTAGEIMNQAITNEAKVLLSTPERTINQIARELNFSDQYAFSKFFKRRTSLSPSAFREKM
ncbi:AraC family transcriptional regulator [uncultured Acetobacteroides sp.]|uniref:helix-turn-helix domain-containing protein n=1 Tax=uncultured Acetobacteroides sp. TaxID=1760811 RepID=UPI0029F58D10|nr:AraC family transcriptional regulator [uncultured Acetobacteroides sp.]